MAPFYDIYGFSRLRNKQTIEKFLAHFCIREMAEDREGQEIWSPANARHGLEEIEIPVQTLTEVIDYGVNHPKQGFAFYISEGLKNVKSIILKFTFDGNMIFGISIEEKMVSKDGKLLNNYLEATQIAKQIATLTESIKTSIQFEYPPSDDEAEFNSDMELWKGMNEEWLREFGA